MTPDYLTCGCPVDEREICRGCGVCTICDGCYCNEE